MSIIETYRNSIARKRTEVTKLLADKARESTKIANASKKIDSAQSAINRTSNQTTIKNRLRDIERAEREKTESYKKIAAIDGKVSKLEREISNDEKRLNQENEYTGIIRTPFRYYPDSVTVLSGFSSGIIRTAF